MSDLKPAIQTLEGKLYAVIVAAGVSLLGYLANGDIPTIDEETIVQMKNAATTVKEFKEVWQLSVSTPLPTELAGLGKFGAVLVFLYKCFTKFTSERVALKMAEIQAKSNSVETK